jgi:signal transduction histidine kinase
MHQSVNYIGNSGIKSLLKAFDIEGIFIEKDSYAEVLEAVKNDEADAAVTSKDFAILHLAKYELISTPIIFQPATLYFTFPKGNANNSFLIDTIDGHIRALKGNESSTYYKLMTKWFNVQSEKFVIPQWVFWLLSVSILFISLLAVGSQLLRIRVKERTSALTLEIQRRKRFEDELYENKRLLEETVRERTAELKHSNEELERFAYITSHDLQEPLRMITSYLQLLESRYRDKIDSDANDFIFYAVDGAKRMQQLINDLLKYSRLDTHKKEHGPVDCNDVVNDVLSNLEIAIKESGADIQLMTLPVVTGDETQLRQIFQNLIGNAVKFKGDRPLEIAVNVNEDEEYWWFTVKDNGIGIEEKYFERIFQVFQRLHGSRQYDGNGIGLAICRKIVENHGGTITVSSKAGEGSRFTFSIAKRGSKHAGKNREFN